jgi:hypothetical protein
VEQNLGNERPLEEQGSFTSYIISHHLALQTALGKVILQTICKKEKKGFSFKREQLLAGTT